MNDQSFIDALRAMLPKSIPVCSCCGMTEEEGHDQECIWYEPMDEEKMSPPQGHRNVIDEPSGVS